VFFDFLAISLLGLEPTCYDQASNSEKASIKLVLFSFSIILIFSLIATFIIGLFVSGNNWMAFLIAILGTYILISILRFSLILIKPEIKIFTQINEVVIKTTWKEKITKIKTYFANKFKKFEWNFNVPIPGFTLFFRLLYLGLLSYVIIFPLTLLSNWEDVKSYNNELRESALQTYKEAELTFQRHAFDSSRNAEFEEKIRWYEEKISHEYFTTKLFLRGMNYPSFTAISFLVFILFALPHFLLFRLMKKQSNTYVNAVKKYFASLITNDFQDLKNNSKSLLKSKGFNPDQLNLVFLDKNNPYLTQKPAEINRENISWKNWRIKLVEIQTENQPKVES
jgi:hypothetical protein